MEQGVQQEAAARRIQEQQRAKAARILHKVGAVTIWPPRTTWSSKRPDPCLEVIRQTQAEWDELTAGLIEALAEAGIPLRLADSDRPPGRLYPPALQVLSQKCLLGCAAGSRAGSQHPR